MSREEEVRRRLEFGAQIDHAPLIGFEVVNLALRLEDNSAHSIRRRILRLCCVDRRRHSRWPLEVTAGGIRFYADWRERLVEAATALGVAVSLVCWSSRRKRINVTGVAHAKARGISNRL